MDEVRRRTIDNARTEAAGLAHRLKLFIETYDGEGEQLLSVADTAWLVAAHRALKDFETKELT